MVYDVTAKEQLERVACALSLHLSKDILIFLSGDLGAGKTTFVRYLLRALGYQGRVKSPTFALLEPYTLPWPLYHFDLYRLTDSEELHFIGMREYLAQGCCLIEWPEKGTGFLPQPDIRCIFTLTATKRELTLTSSTERGKEILVHLV